MITLLIKRLCDKNFSIFVQSDKIHSIRSGVEAAEHYGWEWKIEGPGVMTREEFLSTCYATGCCTCAQARNYVKDKNIFGVSDIIAVTQIYQNNNKKQRSNLNGT